MPATRAGAVSRARGAVEANDPGAPALADLDEPRLIEACLAGRPGAFDLVVERHRRSV